MSIDLHIPYSDDQAQDLIESNEIRFRKKGTFNQWASQACFFIAASAAGLALLSYLKGNHTSNIVYVFIGAGLLAYKGFHYLWQSQLVDVNIAEWNQDNGLHALNDFELAELKRFLEPHAKPIQMLESWKQNGLTVRRRDKNYLLSLIMDDMEDDLRSKTDHG